MKRAAAILFNLSSCLYKAHTGQEYSKSDCSLVEKVTYCAFYD